jgi:hypothetical protein
MKLRRREFMGLLGVGMTSASAPPWSLLGAPGEATHNVEKNGWRLQVTPAGEIVSLTDGNLELVNRRLGDNRPHILVGGLRPYSCTRPAVARQEGAGLLFRYDFSGRDRFSVSYELALVGTP